MRINEIESLIKDVGLEEEAQRLVIDTIDNLKRLESVLQKKSSIETRSLNKMKNEIKNDLLEIFSEWVKSAYADDQNERIEKTNSFMNIIQLI